MTPCKRLIEKEIRVASRVWQGLTGPENQQIDRHNRAGHQESPAEPLTDWASGVGEVCR